MIRTLQLFFNPHSSCTLIDVIRTSETVKSEALSVTRLQLMRTAVLYPGAGLAATPASTPTPPHLSILQVEVSLLHRNTLVSAIMWFMLSNATHVTRSISEKLVNTWVTDLGNRSTLQKATTLRSSYWTPFCFPVAHNSGHTGFCNLFGFKGCHGQT